MLVKKSRELAVHQSCNPCPPRGYLPKIQLQMSRSFRAALIPLFSPLLPFYSYCSSFSRLFGEFWKVRKKRPMSQFSSGSSTQRNARGETRLSFPWNRPCPGQISGDYSFLHAPSLIGLTDTRVERRAYGKMMLRVNLIRRNASIGGTRANCRNNPGSVIDNRENSGSR